MAWLKAIFFFVAFMSSSIPHVRALAPPILCLGDSLTAGYGVPSNANYPAMLEKVLGRRVINAGVNGDTSAGAAARLHELLESHKPELVLVGIGGNDFLRGVPLEHTKQHLHRIAETSFSAGVNCVFIAEPFPDIGAALMGRLYDHPVYTTVASETGAGLYAGGWCDVMSRPGMLLDPIHANARGYAHFSERLAKWLREMKLVA